MGVCRRYYGQGREGDETECLFLGLALDVVELRVIIDLILSTFTVCTYQPLIPDCRNEGVTPFHPMS